MSKAYTLAIYTKNYDSASDSYKYEHYLLIGSNEMSAQCRVLEPVLTTNINGTNTFTFNMYYKYIDIITGEEIINPFVEFLTNETNLGLDWDGEFYLFTINDIKKDSKNIKISYTCSDTFITELSKNGYDVTFDYELNNNQDTVTVLAKRALEGTDWEVDETSDFLAQTAEENLVRLRVNNITGDVESLDVHQISDSAPDDILSTTTLSNLLGPTTVDEEIIYKDIYAFYSCCSKKEKRFEFIYIPSGENISVKNGEYIINNANRHYYIDLADSDYVESANTKKLSISIPKFCALITTSEYNSEDVGIEYTISQKYRGEKYCFNAITEYSPLLKQQVEILFNPSNDKIYQQVKTEVVTPELITECVTNNRNFKYEVKDSLGWIGSKTSNTDSDNAEIDIIAYNQNNIPFSEAVKRGILDTDAFKSYLHLTFKSDKSLVYNSGFYDNRTIIGSLTENELYQCQLKLKTPLQSGNNLVIKVAPYQYYAIYKQYQPSATNVYLNFSDFILSGDCTYIANARVEKTISPEDFQKKNQKIGLFITSNAATEIFIESLSVFKLPSEDYARDEHIFSVDSLNETMVSNAKPYTNYIYYKASEVNAAEDLTKVKPIKSSETKLDEIKINNVTYSKKFSCEKHKSITTQHSNYYNIIQSLCETFECWVRYSYKLNDDLTLTKKIKFLRYVGEEKYTGIRYGVNLDSIQRLDTSKDIVTKLIVGANSNEFADDGEGTCSIQKAGSNISKDNCLYNFDYFIKTGQLDKAQLQLDLYVPDNGAIGQDVLFTESFISGQITTNGTNRSVILFNTPLTDYGFEISVQPAADEVFTIIDFTSVNNKTVNFVWAGAINQVRVQYYAKATDDNNKDITNCNGFYSRLNNLNIKIMDVNKQWLDNSKVYKEVSAKTAQLEVLVDEAQQAVDSALDDFESNLGFAYDKINEDINLVNYNSITEDTVVYYDIDSCDTIIFASTQEENPTFVRLVEGTNYTKAIGIINFITVSGTTISAQSVTTYKHIKVFNILDLLYKNSSEAEFSVTSSSLELELSGKNPKDGSSCIITKKDGNNYTYFAIKPIINNKVTLTAIEGNGTYYCYCISGSNICRATTATYDDHTLSIVTPSAFQSGSGTIELTIENCAVVNSTSFGSWHPVLFGKDYYTYYRNENTFNYKVYNSENQVININNSNFSWNEASRTYKVYEGIWFARSPVYFKERRVFNKSLTKNISNQGNNNLTFDLENDFLYGEEVYKTTISSEDAHYLIRTAITGGYNYSATLSNYPVNDLSEIEVLGSLDGGNTYKIINLPVTSLTSNFIISFSSTEEFNCVIVKYQIAKLKDPININIYFTPNIDTETRPRKIKANSTTYKKYFDKIQETYIALQSAQRELGVYKYSPTSSTIDIANLFNTYDNFSSDLISSVQLNGIDLSNTGWSINNHNLVINDTVVQGDEVSIILISTDVDYGYKAKAAAYQKANQSYLDQLSILRKKKNKLNAAFYRKYNKFLREGTWIDEKYLNSEQYYLDAQNVLYNSCYPKVSYTLSALELSSISGFEEYSFKVGDRTFISDPEFFGYDADGLPNEEDVVFSEVTYNLDDPTKNTIKIQTSRNQFQDLFQAITATVQQVQQTQGQFQSTSKLIQADANTVSSYLTSQLNNAVNTILVGGQSVVQDERGITITGSDASNSKNKILRIASGGIFLSNDGGKNWLAGLSTDGISANLIVKGRIDTNEIQIYNEDIPMFKWNKLGLTAYNFIKADNDKIIIDPRKGVRFDQFGLYGYNTDLTEFMPTSTQDVEENSQFALTWEGLKITYKPENTVYEAKLGKVTDIIYHSWNSTTGMPSQSGEGYAFVPVFQAGEKGNYKFTLYSDGTLACKKIYVTESIGYTPNASPVFRVYAHSVSGLQQISDNTYYNSFPETSSTGWHLTLDSNNDVFYSQTYNGGETWSAPTLLSDINRFEIILTSSRGEVFYNGVVSTNLTAKVYHNGNDITNQLGQGFYTNYSLSWTVDGSPVPVASLSENNTVCTVSGITDNVDLYICQLIDSSQS